MARQDRVLVGAIQQVRVGRPDRQEQSPRLRAFRHLRLSQQDFVMLAKAASWIIANPLAPVSGNHATIMSAAAGVTAA